MTKLFPPTSSLQLINGASFLQGDCSTIPNLDVILSKTELLFDEI